MKFNQLKNPIATIDTETLGLSSKALVIEVGIIVTNVLPIAGETWAAKPLSEIAEALANYDVDRGIVFEAWSYYPSLLEQTLLGRSADLDTVKFHEKLDPELSNRLQTEQQCATSLATLFTALRNLVKRNNVNEVWMNHPQFDSTKMLETLSSECGSGELPWRFNEEYDVSTSMKLYRDRCANLGIDALKLPASPNLHKAIPDCLYNLAAISLGKFGNPNAVG